MKKNNNILLLGLLVFVFFGCSTEKEVLITGQTMGTTYSIKVVTADMNQLAVLKDDVDVRLDEINQSMSTFRPDSEISRFNAWTQPEGFAVSEDFMTVAKTAGRLHQLSGGAWDATIMPLVDLWGFGKGKNLQRIPTENQVNALLEQVGFDGIEFLGPNSLKKKNTALSLDFASIAKGYGVNQIVGLLRSRGFENFLVEIGGEVYAAGHKQNGDRWRVGINYPEKHASRNDIYRVVALQDRALATSGDYRNFYEIGGRFFSHVIDPRTGYPVANQVVSASIISSSCTFADGLATAVMVMGPKAGIQLIDRLPETEGLIVVRQPDGQFTDHFSAGMHEMLKHD